MIALFLNGEAPTAKSLPNLNSYSHIMCTDGAYNYLQTLGIKPQYICGDFDSISAEPPAALRQHLPDQNYTDFEKTLQFILANKLGKNIHVFGGSGKEQDHFLGNLSVAKTYSEKLNLTFYDQHQLYFLTTTSTTFKAKLGEIVSLIPFPKAAEIFTNGLKYPLENGTLELGVSLGIRNEANKTTVSIEFKQGCLAIFKERNELD